MTHIEFESGTDQIITHDGESVNAKTLTSGEAALLESEIGKLVLLYQLPSDAGTVHKLSVNSETGTALVFPEAGERPVRVTGDIYSAISALIVLNDEATPAPARQRSQRNQRKQAPAATVGVPTPITN